MPHFSLICPLSDLEPWHGDCNPYDMEIKNRLFQLGVLVVSGALSGCAEKKISEEKTTDTSHNIFTGSDTVTKDTESTYQNRKTGAVHKETTTQKSKYDKNGKLILKSQETEKK